jgi:hypothetical protein
VTKSAGYCFSHSARFELYCMVENGTMPASSHGLPTSTMRDISRPVFGFRIFTASIHGRCGV